MGELTEIQQEDRSSIDDLIREGKPVALQLSESSRYSSRVKSPILFLTPMSIYGGEKDRVLVALEGHFCEVLDLFDLDRNRLWRIGMTYYSADLLRTEIAKSRSGQE